MHRFTAPAKVNLSLRVLGRRPDGYHLVRSRMTFVHLADTVAIRLRDDGRLTLACDPPVTADPADNLVWRAAELLRRLTGVRAGADLHLTKRIPAAAGLGGGSSDAATVLLALDWLWGTGLGRAGLLAPALELGADVPFFVQGESALAEGIGERLTPWRAAPRLDLVLVNPNQPLATPTVFRAFAQQLTNPPPVTNLPPSTADADWLVNDLQPVATRLLPVIGDIAVRLGTLGAMATLMSGSGPTVVGIFAAAEAARRAGLCLMQEQPGWLVSVGSTRDRHPFDEERQKGYTGPA